MRRIGIALLSVLTAVVIAVAFSGTARADTTAYNLYNPWSAKCADLPGFGADPVNTAVAQYTCDFSTNDNQRWSVVQTRTSGGVPYYWFVNVKSGLCLDPPGFGSNAAGTHLAIYYCGSTPANDNQEWYLAGPDRTDPITGAAEVEIVNVKSGLCLDVAGWAGTGGDLANDQPLTLYDCSNASWANGGYDDHLWEIIQH